MKKISEMQNRRQKMIFWWNKFRNSTCNVSEYFSWKLCQILSVLYTSMQLRERKWPAGTRHCFLSECPSVNHFSIDRNFYLWSKLIRKIVQVTRQWTGEQIHLMKIRTTNKVRECRRNFVLFAFVSKLHMTECDPCCCGFWWWRIF